jgi:hypothetical protein
MSNTADIVNIVLAPGFGSPWEGTFKQRFDAALIAALLADDEVRAAKCLKKMGLTDTLPSELAVVTVNRGVRFMISEYDGAESILTEGDLPHRV